MDIRSARLAFEGRVWIGDLPDMEDLRLLVAPWENRAYTAIMDRKVRALPPNLRMTSGGGIDRAAVERITAEAISEAILFGWENFTDGGQAVEWTKERALEYLRAPEYRSFMDAVIVASQRAARVLAEKAAQTEGNSSSSPAGAATGASTQNG